MASNTVIPQENNSVISIVISNKCIECNNKGTKRAKTNIILCKICCKLEKYEVITKTKAKLEYFLNETDLEGVNSIKANSSYGLCTYYMKTDIINKACSKYNVPCENLDELLKNMKLDKTNVKKYKMEIKLEKEKKASDKRKEKLIDELYNVGLELRSDSVLCSNYINGKIKNGSLDDIVKRMCQMKYLYDYCHMEECKDIAYKNQQDDWKHGYHPDCSVSDDAELIALDKYSKGKYPVVFPWQV
jgi:hypothetical protein